MNSEQKEIAERIRLAREFRYQTCGAVEIGDNLFPEPRPQRVKHDWQKFGTTLSQADAIRAAQWEAHKKKNGGIVGVVQEIKRGRPSCFRAVLLRQKRTYHACAIEAAEARNACYDREYPGIEVAQCDMDAVWRKWGCNCGKHKRPES
jgi:hypothetical protein